MSELSSVSSRNVTDDWVVLWTVVAAGIIAAFHVGEAAIATPHLQAEFGLDFSAAGSLTSVIAILGMIGGIPAGALVARAGDRFMLVTGLALLLGSSAGAAFAPSFAVLLVLRTVEGLGFLLITVAGP